LFNLFLSKAQVNLLMESYGAEVSVIEDKMITPTLKLSDTPTHLTLHVADSFNPSMHQASWFHLSSYSPTLYFVNSTNISRSASYFANCDAVYSISLMSPPKLMNRLGVGYSQSNTNQLNANGTFTRFLDNEGLTGENVVVTVIDSSLDLESIYFYDPNHPEPGPEHRKVLLSEGPGVSNYHEHGTHVCGTIAGHSLTQEGSAFNGFAPLAKLVHFALTGTEEPVNPDEVFAAIISALSLNSHISSNSWGLSGGNAVFRSFVMGPFCKFQTCSSFSRPETKLWTITIASME
jgi:hypothetical protein